MDSDIVEEIKRHFGVIAEGLRSDIRGIAEGQDLLRETLTKRIDAHDARFDALDRKVDGLTHVVQLTYSEVTGRLSDHEARLGALERRQP
jgi:hypothetical protein